MAKRIQRKRTKGWRMPEGAVYVGRPSKWGNPYRVGETELFSPLWNGRPITTLDAADAVRRYKAWMASSRMRVQNLVPELRGKDLVCWCPLNQACHADVLLEWANEAVVGR